MHTLFGTGYTHGASRVNVKVYFLCSSVYIDKKIHASVKNLSAEGTCLFFEILYLPCINICQFPLFIHPALIYIKMGWCILG